MPTINSWGSQVPVTVSKGGTGNSTLTSHGVMCGSGTGAVTPLAVGTSGQVLVGSTGADPTFHTLTSSDSSITFTTGAGTLSLQAVASSKFDINAQTSTSYTLVIGDAGKLVTLTNAAAITLTIPPHVDVAFDNGQQVALYAKGAGTVTVTAGAGVTLRSRGSVYDSAGQYAMISIVQDVENTWIVSGDIA